LCTGGLFRELAKQISPLRFALVEMTRHGRGFGREDDGK
jgi:hypothetical protein